MGKQRVRSRETETAGTIAHGIMSKWEHVELSQAPGFNSINAVCQVTLVRRLFSPKKRRHSVLARRGLG